MPGCSAELIFTKSRFQWTLNRIRFVARDGDTARETLWGDRFRHDSPSFAWTRALRALSLLLVRHAVGAPPAALIGGPDSPVRTLANLLEHPARSSAARPFSDGNGNCQIGALLTLSTAGRNHDGDPEHSIKVCRARLPARRVTIIADGVRIESPADACGLLQCLARAWPHWQQPSTPVAPPAEGRPGLTARCRRTTECERNQRIAAFYARALTDGPLTAASGALAEAIDGAVHLTFMAGPRGGFEISTNQGEQGRRFCQATMGAAASNPLLFQCRGKCARSPTCCPRASGAAWRFGRLPGRFSGWRMRSGLISPSPMGGSSTPALSATAGSSPTRIGGHSSCSSLIFAPSSGGRIRWQR